MSAMRCLFLLCSALLSAESVLRSEFFLGSNVKAMAAVTEKFVEYHLYFETANLDKDLLQNAFTNSTDIDISRSINACPNLDYKLRVLSRNQVSWKVRNDEDKKEKKKKRFKGLHNSTSSNSTTSADDIESNVEYDDSEDGKREQVHKYLVFAMLLPSHPFSQQLNSVLRAVAVMYPSVSVVIGNAYEFRDLTSKYYVHSFPKAVFFKQGMFYDCYEGEFTVPLLAGQFTKWTREFPRTFPPLPSAVDQMYKKKWQERVRYIPLDLSAITFWGRSLPTIYIPLPAANIEPFLSSVEHPELWDGCAFVLAGLYTVGRVAMFSRKFLKWRQD